MRMTHEDRAKRRAAISKAVEGGGMSVLEACAEFGVSVDTVYASSRTRRGRRVSAWKVLERLLKTNLTYQAVGDEFGISRQRVEQVRRLAEKAGVRFEGRR